LLGQPIYGCFSFIMVETGCFHAPEKTKNAHPGVLPGSFSQNRHALYVIGITVTGAEDQTLKELKENARLKFVPRKPFRWDDLHKSVTTTSRGKLGFVHAKAVTEFECIPSGSTIQDSTHSDFCEDRYPSGKCGTRSIEWIHGTRRRETERRKYETCFDKRQRREP
jgi:hypothetical protein